MVEVVVTLDAPALGEAVTLSRALAAAAKRSRVDLRSPTSAAYLRALAASQRQFELRLRRAIPSARVRWRYGVVLNGLAVTLPAASVARLERLAGARDVYPSATYRSLLDRSPGQMGAPALWGPGFTTAGNGMKIGIIDDGVDPSHPFFEASGLAAPPGFPRGQRDLTTAKVVVARAFPPRSPGWRYAGRAFDPQHSEHATHVAGIAAGGHGVAVSDRSTMTVSGVAPNAYIGNYKVLTIPTASGVGLDGNAPEIVAGIEAAVRDGMDVINLSLGEPEIEPSRDIVVAAINGAAAAGVIPVVAAGNDYQETGRGSIGSPGTARNGITVAAVTTSRGGTAGVVAEFSSSGPTPMSLQLKPDVSAPGVRIVSSVPGHAGLWAILSGTSMAAPHVAGAAALLKQRHRNWTPAQVKAALALTGDPVYATDDRGREAPATRQGGGAVNLVRADVPLIFAAPTSVSFGLLRRGAAAARTVALTDAGGGGGPWTISVQQQASASGVTVAVPATVSVPGRLVMTARATDRAAETDIAGHVVLTRGAERRRIPFWGRVAVRRLAAARPEGLLVRDGFYRGNTSGKRARVSVYRYPDDPRGLGIPRVLRGPEQVFRVRVRRPVANFGVAVITQTTGTRVQPRIVAAGDEYRQVGYASLPLNINPYLATFGRKELVSGAIRPARGEYDVVFDSVTRAAAGRFLFRFWMNDTTPPAVRVLSRSPVRGTAFRLAVTDRGSGVDPSSMFAVVDNVMRKVTYSRARGVASVPIEDLAPGRHSLSIQVSDYQEAKNMENVLRILPNTRVFSTTFVTR